MKHEDLDELEELIVAVLNGELAEDDPRVAQARRTHPELDRELEELRALEGRLAEEFRLGRDILEETRVDGGTPLEDRLEARALSLGRPFAPRARSRSLRILCLLSAAAILLWIVLPRARFPERNDSEAPPIFLSDEAEAPIFLVRPSSPPVASAFTGLEWRLRDLDAPVDGYDVELFDEQQNRLGTFRAGGPEWKPDPSALERLLEASFVRVIALDPFGQPRADLASIFYPRGSLVVRD